MDKQKIKIILIAVAVLLAIFLLYRTFSRISDNKTAAAGKIDSANADLTIKQNQDAYIASRENQKKTDEEKKVGMLNDAQTAEGYLELSDYMDTLSDSQRELYKSMRSDYIRVMGVDPGVMSFADLQKWSETYAVWCELNDRYIELTGESKSFLDPDFDTVDEMKSAISAAEVEVLNGKAQLERKWRDAYEDFLNGFPEFRAVSLDIIKRWLPYPEDMVDLKDKCRNLQLNFAEQRMPKLDRLFDRLKDYFNGGYIVWKSSAHRNVKGANDLPAGTLDEVSYLSNNDLSYLTDKLKKSGGFSIYTKVKGNNPSEKKTFTNFVDACLAVAYFQQQCKESVGIVGAVLSLGISAAIEKNNKVLNYMPERAKYLFERAEIAGNDAWTTLGYSQRLLDSIVGGYSQGKYGFGDGMYGSIEANKATIWDWIESDQYKAH
ncbi:MAG: hypothetical protein KIH03_07215 [Paludibacteraceae bacterium]|nr:hypothetical protein [Paludibacteraceae bacterium]